MGLTIHNKHMPNSVSNLLTRKKIKCQPNGFWELDDDETKWLLNEFDLLDDLCLRLESDLSRAKNSRDDY